MMTESDAKGDAYSSSDNWLEGQPYNVILFYRYVNINNVDTLRSELLSICSRVGILGRILIANEGINGTLAGSTSSIDTFIQYMKADERFYNTDWKMSTVEPNKDNLSSLPFLSLSIRETKEIISTGRSKAFISSNTHFDDQSFGGLSDTGEHLAPVDFHAAIENLKDSDGTLLDIRNQFEYDIGHFDQATGLNCATYAESWPILDDVLSTKETHSPVYMYCTGGIRCEKASIYLKAKGFQNVYQLQGGIHRYLEEYPEGGHFKGKNFVFDSRVSVPAISSRGVPMGEGEEADSEAADALISLPCLESSSSPSSCGAGVVPGTQTGGGIIGRCVDCSRPYDSFSGQIVCTVCRLPVLVCGVCAVEKCHPGEYHCFRHRHLKHMYFTVLERFSEEELRGQIIALSDLERELLVDKKAKSRRRTLRNQKERIAARLLELGLQIPQAECTAKHSQEISGYLPTISASTSPSIQLEVVPVSPVEYAVDLDRSLERPLDGQSGREENVSENATVTKVIAEHYFNIQLGQSDENKNNSSNSSGGRLVAAAESPLPSTTTRVHTHAHRDYAPHTTEENLYPSVPNLIPNLITVPGEQNIPSNPKTRLGWGFWKT